MTARGAAVLAPALQEVPAARSSSYLLTLRRFTTPPNRAFIKLEFLNSLVCFALEVSHDYQACR